MNRIPLRSLHVRPQYTLSDEDMVKYDYVNTFQSIELFNRLYRLLSPFGMKSEVMDYLLESYLYGHSKQPITAQQLNLIMQLNDYIELYLYHGLEEYYHVIAGEFQYNSLYNPLFT